MSWAPAVDPVWALEDGELRRAYLGHQDELDVPGFCTCGVPAVECPRFPRRWRGRFAADDARAP